MASPRFNWTIELPLANGAARRRLSRRGALACGAVGLIAGCLAVRPFTTCWPEALHWAWTAVAIVAVVARDGRMRPACWALIASCCAAAVIDVATALSPFERGDLLRMAWCACGLMLAIAVLRRCLSAAACRLAPNLVQDRRWRTAAFVTWVLLLVGLSTPALLAYMQVHPPRRHPTPCPSDAESVTLRTRDGVRLDAWYLPSAVPSSRAVVVCHGVMDHKGAMLPIARSLVGAGFNVLLFDFRGHGRSAGWTVSYGARETLDVRSALDYLTTERSACARHIVGYGWSMGAAVLIEAAATDPRLQALCLDAPYASTRDMAAVITRNMPAVIAALLEPAGLLLASCEAQANLFTAAPIRHMGRFSPRPVLIIHGEADDVIPIAQGRAVFEAAGQPRTWHAVPGAGHCQTLDTEGPVYMRRVIGFFEAALVPS